MKYWLFAVLVAMPAAANAQTDPRIRASSAADFLAKARSASAAYLDQDAALLDGFRPLGPELPMMGRHWINQEYANLGYVDPARPAFLLYVTIDGKQRLGGVGYALALQPGDKLPVIPAAAWHEHTGSVDDEAYRLTHHMADDPSRFRLVAIHVWLDFMPPDTFAAENWSLPFYRKGMVPDSVASIQSARILSLAYGGAAYYREVLRRHAALDERTAADVGRLLDEYAEYAVAWPKVVGGGNMAQLNLSYEEMFMRLARLVTPEQARSLERIKQLWQSTH